MIFQPTSLRGELLLFGLQVSQERDERGPRIDWPKKNHHNVSASHVQSTQGEVTSCKMDVGDIFREAGSEAGRRLLRWPTAV